MIGYTTIGVSDMESACKFYGELLGELGGKQLFGMDRIQFFGTAPDAPMLAVCIPYDEKAPESGNGTMIAIPAGGPAGVDKLYTKAIELGATDDGAQETEIPLFTALMCVMRTAINYASMK